MKNGLRWTERLMNAFLWLVALVFAGLLIALGSLVVARLGSLAETPSPEAFMDPGQRALAQQQRDRAVEASRTADQALEQAQQKHQEAKADTASARETFENWVATRHATVRPDQDAELIARTRALDKLAAEERKALAAVEAQQQARLDANQAEAKASVQWDHLLEPARAAAEKAWRHGQLIAFLARLALVVPLLLVAVLVFKRARKGRYWPFAWGFIFFALFAFFVELVPYLPSYGGYVHLGVGIALTVAAGRYAIRWRESYLARQKAAEALPESERRQTMRYESTLGRMAKGMCPSCERTLNFKDETLAHCPHCGIRVFNRCTSCTSRKNAFSKFCFSCGTPAGVTLAD